MKLSMTCLTAVGLMLIAGCGEQSMLENDARRVVPNESLSSVRIHVNGFKKSKSGAT